MKPTTKIIAMVNSKRKHRMTLDQLAEDMGMSDNTLRSKLEDPGKMTVADAAYLYDNFGIETNIKDGELERLLKRVSNHLWCDLKISIPKSLS